MLYKTIQSHLNIKYLILIRYSYANVLMPNSNLECKSLIVLRFEKQNQFFNN